MLFFPYKQKAKEELRGISTNIEDVNNRSNILQIYLLLLRCFFFKMLLTDNSLNCL